MEHLEMFYHKPTKTVWVNDKNWLKRLHNNEGTHYGYVDIDIDNVFEMKSYMEQLGYTIVLNKDNPIKFLFDKYR